MYVKVVMNHDLIGDFEEGFSGTFGDKYWGYIWGSMLFFLMICFF